MHLPKKLSQFGLREGFLVLQIRKPGLEVIYCVTGVVELLVRLCVETVREIRGGIPGGE